MPKKTVETGYLAIETHAEPEDDPYLSYAPPSKDIGTVKEHGPFESLQDAKKCARGILKKYVKEEGFTTKATWIVEKDSEFNQAAWREIEFSFKEIVLPGQLLSA